MRKQYGNPNSHPFFIIIYRILFAELYIFSRFNQTYLIKEIKYLLELKKKCYIHRTKLLLAIELHFLVNANKYLFRSPETQDLVESSRFSLTLPNLFMSALTSEIIYYIWIHEYSSFDHINVSLTIKYGPL